MEEEESRIATTIAQAEYLEQVRLSLRRQEADSEFRCLKWTSVGNDNLNMEEPCR